LLEEETHKPYYGAACKDIFKALAITSYDQVRVLLVGQDPYPTPGYAHGLCFSVKPTVRPLPFSLRNIYRELHEDVGCQIPNNGDLEPWARQGVLMLNTVLTVRAHQANTHQGRGWERFTDRIIELIAAKEKRVVFVLWGRTAQKKQRLITQSQHVVIACAHPSPLSVRKFFGCRCFSHINRNLADAGLGPIDWQIPDV
jgi:uracil-DNA glycosylase